MGWTIKVPSPNSANNSLITWGKADARLAFSVIDWTAFVIFITVIGGIGTLPGPIIGVVVFYALQRALADYGAAIGLAGAIAGSVLGFALTRIADHYRLLEQGLALPDSAPSYRAFIEDDAQYQGSPRHDRDRDYWLAKYQQLPDALLAPRERNAVHLSPPSAVLEQPFDTRLLARMRALGSTLQASPFHVLLAALHVCSARTWQRDEWVVGLPILNRSGARFKGTLGLFTQVSAMRMGFGRVLSFAELIKAIGDSLKQDFRHQRYPLSEMNRALGLLREDRAQLFELSVSYEQDDHDYRYGEASGHSVKVSNQHEATPLALHLRSNRFDDNAWMHYVYDTGYFQPHEIEALAANAAPWLTGDRPGALDAYALTLLRWGGYAGIDPTTFPATWDLAQRFAALPAVARAVEREKLQLNVYQPATTA